MDHYLQNNVAKRNFLRKGVMILIAMALIFAAFITRFALSGSGNEVDGAPRGDDAYTMAKKFVRPTIKSVNVVFPESGYQCAQKPDSVFVVKSYAEAKDQPGPKSITPFEITLKFSGGKVEDKNNWKILGIIEE